MDKIVSKCVTANCSAPLDVKDCGRQNNCCGWCTYEDCQEGCDIYKSRDANCKYKHIIPSEASQCNGCSEFKDGNCTRIGFISGKVGVCWMEHGEGEY